MLTRIITAIVLIIATLAWLFIADYPVFTMGALLIYTVGAWEMGPLVGYAQRIPFLVLACVLSSALFFIAPPGLYVSHEVPAVLKVIICSSLPLWLVSLPLLWRYPQGQEWAHHKLYATIYGLWLLVPFLFALLTLRAQNYALDPKAGAYLVLSVMALVWCADSGAYFCGRFLGRHKMLPNVSPKKTLEGLLGGIVTALLGLFVFTKLGCFGSFAEQPLNLTVSGVLVILFSVEGDLVESMLKRIAGIKDSGRIFPGHGGMLDRIDSQLAAVPLFLTFNWLLGGELF
ncbi:MAG: phosphatidate cytidylyltransferase [Succinivibrio sp.]|nr:phosphatidate cytidylyltransferase [Succinivibrio sp.]